MPPLLVIILAVELVVQAVNTIGAATINDTLWNLYNTLPGAASKEYAEQRKLQQDYLKVRRDLNATSSQDEFAKWAKLRRHHDKLLEQLEKKKAALGGSRAQFDKIVTTVRLISTRGMQYFIPFWFAKQPMFWLPYGWFPYYAEWLLSFPRAPLGSVSVASWQVACTGVVLLLKDTLVAIAGLVLSSREAKPQPTKVPAGKTPSTAGKGEKAS